MTKEIEYTIKVWENGTKEWRVNGLLHRIDGPAIEWWNGSKNWYRYDRLHREDGPAVELSDGRKEWYLNGKLYSTEARWKKALKKNHYFSEDDLKAVLAIISRSQ